MRATLTVLLPVLLAACGDEQAIDTGWWLEEGPDITGQYQFFIDSVSASSTCEKQVHYVTDWMPGALGIRGDGPQDLTFTFSSGMAFAGGVDSTWTYWYSGTETFDGASVAISARGVIGTDGSDRTINGSVEAEVDDDEFTTNNCVIEVQISGQRISD